MAKEPLLLNDLHVGMAWSGQSVELTADVIIGFGRQYDPQPFHVDRSAAESGPFDGLIASGWQLAALAMRQFVEAQPFGSSPILGLGVDELRWLKPVRPGDIVLARGEIVELRPSKSKPDRGVVRTAITLVNQAGDVVMSFLTRTQLPVRVAVT